MLDSFEILTTSGIVLWHKHYVPISPTPINNLINDVLIEERGSRGIKAESSKDAPYRTDKYTLRWARAKDVGVVFVAVYQSLLHLTWVENLLAAVKALFIKRYATELKKPAVTSLDCADFVYTFDALVTKLDTGSTKRVDDFQSSVTAVAPALPPGIATTGGENSGLASASRAKQPPQPQSREVQTPNETACDTTPLRTPDTTRPSTPSQASHLVTGKGGPGKASRRVRKAALVTAPVACGDEAATGRSKPGQNKAKQMRRWDADGFAVVGDEDVQLDYSAAPLTNINDDIAPNVDEIPADRMGRRTGKGQFALKDLEDEVDAILASTKDGKASTPARAGEAPSGTLESASFKISSFFRNIVGGRKLTEADLRQPLQQMQNHLLEKNVAREAADRLCASVEADLLDQTTASFTSIDKTIHESMIKALTRMLTPTSSLDLVRDISRTIEGPSARPYVISIVGVNGVGKSTNLSKIAYFLLQNQFRVLVVAGDTFRSGAVEQLRVHVRNLSELSRRENVGTVELFEKGYGKDAATVARDAVSSATAAGSDGRILFDVVLIDTAGRRHNDSRLMSSLTKFGQLANPDKIFMVGEALVGTDSVAQARNFAKEFVDTKGRLRNNGVGMDGFIISKCDTVGDMVGTLVSMVHATGIPVVFLGVGQHYGDLRGLNVGWVVDKLVK